MVIGLSGLKGSGKDTAAGYLVKEYGFKRIAFADKLKDSAAAALGIDRADVDKYKNDEDYTVGVFDGETQIHLITFRKYLQLYGSEAHRDIFGENFWVDEVLPYGHYSGRKLVVTDCRFQSEFDRIREVGGVIVEVKRPGLISDGHTSEQPPAADFEINNDDTIEKLFAAVEELLTERLLLA